MEKNEERILAYTLAKEIDPKDLDEVSGGSFKPTGGVTGSPSNPDGFGDVTVDW
jgi:hypothetical protein